jgi:hypothetical protein
MPEIKEKQGDIKSILDMGDGKFRVRSSDSSRFVTYGDLPEWGDVVVESPVLEGVSGKECPLCEKCMTIKYVYKWPATQRGKKIVQYDRTDFYETVEGYECIECKKVKIFSWEERMEGEPDVILLDRPDWYIRVVESEGPFGTFAMNDRTGIYRSENKLGTFRRFVVLKNKEMTETIQIPLRDLAQDNESREVVYKALRDNFQVGDCCYILQDWVEEEKL